MKIEYAADEATGSIVLPDGPPFDGKPVLIRLASGWCEARWDAGYAVNDANGKDYRGWNWVCMDDDFQADLDEALEWVPLPATEESK